MLSDYKNERRSQVNNSLLIVCLVFVSPKCIGRVFDDFLVFYE